MSVTKVDVTKMAAKTFAYRAVYSFAKSLTLILYAIE